MAEITGEKFHDDQHVKPSPTPFSAKLRELKQLIDSELTPPEMHVTVKLSARYADRLVSVYSTIPASVYESNEDFRKYVHTDLETQLARALSRLIPRTTHLYTEDF